MIPERYLDFYGDETRWFIGTVIDINDPQQIGRVKVRIMGIHSDNILDIPDHTLPWAQCVVPITEGGVSALGNILGIQPDARVFGIFLDGTNSQLPLVLGSLPRLETDAKDGRTTSPRARGINTTPSITDDAINEPNDPFNVEYPHNKTYGTKRGHYIEFDDTPSHERIKIYHNSGTFIEMHPNGDIVTHHRNGFKSVMGNDKIHVTGDLNIIAGGDVTIEGKTINLNNGTKGAARIDDTVDTGDDPPGISGSDGSNKVETGSKTVFIGD